MMITSYVMLIVHLYQSAIDLQDFQDAEPDVLLHCASNIIERFNEHEMKCDAALKTLCRKKKGLLAEVRAQFRFEITTNQNKMF